MVEPGTPNPLVRVRFLPPLPRSVHFVHERGKPTWIEVKMNRGLFITINLYDCGQSPCYNFFMYYFYILRSIKEKKLYLGSTPDLKRRLLSHNRGENKATKPHIPYELIFYSGFTSKKDAIDCEQYFKTTAGWRRLKNMLRDTMK